MGGRKSPFPITLANGLYNSLYYRTSRDSVYCFFYNLIYSQLQFDTLLNKQYDDNDDVWIKKVEISLKTKKNDNQRAKDHMQSYDTSTTACV